MGSWKKAWYALRAEAAKKYPRLATVRMYDLRHPIKDIAGQDLRPAFAAGSRPVGRVAGSVWRREL